MLESQSLDHWDRKASLQRLPTPAGPLRHWGRQVGIGDVDGSRPFAACSPPLAARAPPSGSPLAPPCLRRPAAAAARAIAAAGGGSAGSATSTGGVGRAIGSAGGAAGAGAARGGQRGSLPLPDDPTPQQLREWVLQQARLGGGGFGFLLTAQRRQQSQQETFSPQVLNELFPQRCVTGHVEAAALGASESAATLGASESAAALGASESAAALGARASPATETSPTLRWTGKVGDASVFRVWGAISLVRDAKASKISSRTLRCVFLGFPTDAPPWQFYHPHERRVFSSQDVTFDESVCLYRLHPHASHPVPLAPLFLPAAVDSGAETAGAEPGVAETEGEGSGGAATGGATTGGADSGGATTGGASSWGAATGGADSGGPTRPSGGGAVGNPTGGPGAGQPPQPDLLEMLSPQAIRAWIVRRGSPSSGGYGPAGAGAASPRGNAGARGAASPGGTAGAGGAGGAIGARGAGAGGTRGAGAAGPGGARTGGAGAAGDGGTAGAGGTGVAGAGGTAGAGGAGGATGAAGTRGARGTAGAGGAGAGGTGGTGGIGGAGAAGPGGARTRGTGAAGAGGAASAGGAGGVTGAPGTGGAGGTTGAKGPGTAGASGAAGARGAGGAARAAGAGGAGDAGTALRRPFFYLQPQSSLPPPDSVLCQSQPQLLPGSPLPAPAPQTEVIESLTERREPETCVSTPVRARRVARPRPPPVPGTHDMALRPSSIPQRVVLLEPLASSLPHVPDPESDLARAASPTVTRLLATVITDLDLESTATFALVSELVGFAARSRLDCVASLVTESESVCPPFVGGELAFGSDVLEDKQFELECLAAALPRFASMLLCPEGDPDALDIPTPRSYAAVIAREYSSQWRTAMDPEMALWKSTGTNIDEVPPSGANIVDGMWIFRVKRPPGSPPAFKAGYVA
ncbi:unnamed protein product [Closterium sp. NIES-54]